MTSATCPYCDGAGRVDTFWLWFYRVIFVCLVATTVLRSLQVGLWFLERIANG